MSPRSSILTFYFHNRVIVIVVKCVFWQRCYQNDTNFSYNILNICVSVYFLSTVCIYIFLKLGSSTRALGVWRYCIASQLILRLHSSGQRPQMFFLESAGPALLVWGSMSGVNAPSGPLWISPSTAVPVALSAPGTSWFPLAQSSLCYYLLLPHLPQLLSPALFQPPLCLGG